MHADPRITHHELCFGCGQANLFGLQIELEPRPDGAVAGRFFVKQDHQGLPGHAHGGVLAAALDEAMALLLSAQGRNTRTVRLEVDLLAPAPIGAFVLVEAELQEVESSRLQLAARASAASDGRALATARGTFAPAQADLP